jgi:hypothetical protein
MSLLAKSLYFSIPNVASIFIVLIVSLFMISVNVVGFMKGKMHQCLSSHLSLADLDKIITSIDCMNSGGDWVQKKFHFDNIGKSM